MNGLNIHEDISTLLNEKGLLEEEQVSSLLDIMYTNNLEKYDPSTMQTINHLSRVTFQSYQTEFYHISLEIDGLDLGVFMSDYWERSKKNYEIVTSNTNEPNYYNLNLRSLVGNEFGLATIIRLREKTIRKDPLEFYKLLELEEEVFTDAYDTETEILEQINYFDLNTLTENSHKLRLTKREKSIRIAQEMKKNVEAILESDAAIKYASENSVQRAISKVKKELEVKFW